MQPPVTIDKLHRFSVSEHRYHGLCFGNFETSGLQRQTPANGNSKLALVFEGKSTLQALNWPQEIQQ